MFKPANSGGTTITTEKVNYYIKENIVPERCKKYECGPYILEINLYKTKKGCWEISQGIITKENNIITVIDRNYHSFPFEWCLGHPDGHDYLICGRDYMNQTIVQLDTGLIHDVDGKHFCWADYKISHNKNKIVVDGCYWASPYELRIYDFSNPLANTFPVLWNFSEGYVLDEYKEKSVEPKWNEDNSLDFYFECEYNSESGKSVLEMTKEEARKHYDGSFRKDRDHYARWDVKNGMQILEFINKPHWSEID